MTTSPARRDGAGGERNSMSEQEPDYITEGLQLLHGEPSIEVEAPRKVTERRGGQLVETERSAFVKLYTSFKGELKDIDGNELKVWLYLALSINRYTKDARPGLRKIAEDTGMAVNTVRGIVEKLEERGLLDVDKADGKGSVYHPADYVSVSKIDTVTVSKKEATVSNLGGTVSASRREFAQLEELESTRDSGKPLLSETEIQQVNNKVDAIIANSAKADWRGRETFAPQDWALVDWYHNATGQDCPKTKYKDWHHAVTLWKSNGLTVSDLQAAYDMDIKWRGVFTSPNQLTDKAIALRAQGKVKTDEQPKARKFERLNRD